MNFISNHTIQIFTFQLNVICQCQKHFFNKKKTQYFFLSAIKMSPEYITRYFTHK